MRIKLLSISFFILFSLSAYAQCGSGVPGFNVNLTGDPDSTWTSPSISRNGNCCGTSAPDKCINFIITLDPDAAGISFDIIAGAVPGGALFYQINCGPPQALGTAICLEGVGPHLLTFCKPGNNPNVYQITSIPAAVGGTDITVNDGCVDTLNATGFQESTITWNSIFPGASGAYNSYLSCTSGCADPIVTGSGTPPPFVDYVVCGIPASMCNFATLCDTIRVSFYPTLLVTIAPINPTICFGQTSTVITATGSGGFPPYSYLWNSVNPSASISVGAGNYTVMLTDASGCPPTYATVTVTSFSVAISANAGVNDTVCNQSPSYTLSGSVTGASGGVWSGGGGTFSPNTSTLNAIYTPTPAELAAGSVTLTLTTTGNGTCPAANDAVTIFYMGFTGTVNITPTMVSCFGGTNGTAAASVTGGIPPFTYLWNTVPAQSTATATNLAVGTYTVTVTNGIGCTTTQSVTITQPTPLAVSGVITNVNCSGGNNGTVTITASGGTPAYSYLWAPGGMTTAAITGQTAGTYTVTITDSKGCILVSNYTITQPPPLTLSISKTDVSCSGGTDGTATSVAGGGTPPYTYSWAPSGGSAATASGLSVGTYTLTVTDNKGCIITGTITITEPTLLTSMVAVTNETCDYLNNGTATVTPSGGTPGYTYLWTPGGMTTISVSGLAAGTYTVVSTDLEGCTTTAFAVITQPPPIVITMNGVNVNCFAGSDGSATASPTGGTPGYSYLWAPGGGTTSTITGIAAGTYTVTVTDNNACTSTNTVIITQPLLPLALSPAITNVSCSGGSNGAITVTASGGTASYSYLWLPGGQTTATISGQAAGTYTVTVTDAQNCQITSNYTITQPLPLAISFTSSNVSCFGGSDGTATGTVSGGTIPYSYNWSPSGGSGPGATGLIVGTYTLTVTDGNGCIFASSVIIAEPTILSATTTSTDETCDYLNNGTATAIPSGGSPGYTYLWAPGGMTTSTVTGLATGTYTVTVTDSEGCATPVTATIAEPAPLNIVFDFQQNVSCFGGNDGFVSAVASGGTPSYSFMWMPGGAPTNLISGLTAGSYTLTVTDDNGCTLQNIAIITQPALLTVTPSSTPASCFEATDGSVSAIGAGGTAPYSFFWLPGGMTGSTVDSLAAGTYTVTITDANGCTGTNTIVVNEPPEIILVTSTVNSNCGTASGQASVIASGGDGGPYTYLWSPTGGTGSTATGLIAAPYTVTVTDGSGCSNSQFANVSDNSGPVATIFDIIHVSCFGGSDGSASVGVAGGVGPFTYLWTPSGGSSTVATGLTAGSYTVTVIDDNGCESNATTSPDITEPPPIVLAVSTTEVSCFGGSDGTASVIASGGTPGYSYLWLPGGSTGPTVSGLSASSYTVQVTDTNSCIQTSPFTIIEPVAPISVVMSSTLVSCFGGGDGTATAVASGGTAPYNYSWMPGSLAGASIGSLAAGNYTVTITDINGCVLTDVVTVAQPTALALITGSNNANCGTASGLAYVTASGGTGPYDYLWSPGSSTNDTAVSLLPGTYTVTVTDNNGCNANITVMVNNNVGPTATITATTNVSCFGGSDGTATAGVSGGAGPFVYSWSPFGGTAPVATGLPAGQYIVTVTDMNGCISSDTTNPDVTEPPPVVISLLTTNVSCNGGSDGTASSTIFGGTPGYTYLWSPGGAVTANVNSLGDGTYTLQVTDANSCIATSIFSITEPTPVTVSISFSSPVSCFGGANGSATASGSGGTPFYTYSWSGSGGSGSTATGLIAGTYTVTATDTEGCTATTTVVITEPAFALTATASGTPTSCFGGTDGTATASPSGGTPTYSYLWSSGGTGITETGLAAGNYNVLVTDFNGCNTNANVTITQPTQVTGSLSVIDPSCGSSNGSITSMISGGTPGYTYLWTPGSATTPNISGLPPGGYSVQVTDANGCVSNLSATLTNIPGPDVTISSFTNASCFGGSDGTATASITSGTSPFSINWMPYGGTSLTGTGFIAGSYTVIVTDNLGCIDSASVTISQPTPVGISVTSMVPVSCFGGSNGSITVTGTGGTPGYTYSWPAIPSTSATISGLSTGFYTVIVNDLNGCPATISVNVTEPDSMIAVVGSFTNPSCFNSNNGTITLAVSGGTIPYSYAWSDGQTGSVAVGLTAGSYSVVVTDANGCVATTGMLLTQPTQVITSAGNNDTICLGSSATLTVGASGGASGYYYVWQPSGAITGGTYNVTPPVSTTYTVVAYDADGCAGVPDTVSAIVYNLTAANIAALALSPICPGQGTVVYVETYGSTGPLTYAWSGGLGSGPGGFLVVPSSPVTYSVTVTNACGASIVDSVEITFNPPPTVLLTSDTNSICVPATIQFLDNSITGNVLDPIISWLWNFGDGTTSTLQDPTHTFTTPGTYNVVLTISTFGGCTNNNGSAPYVINAYPYPIAAFSVSSTVLDLPYDPLVTDNQSTGATTYQWNFGDGGSSTSFEPTYTYNSVGIYVIQLIATNTFGCADTAYSSVVTNADVIFPNVFTPNTGGGGGGGYNIQALDNDVFFPYTSGVIDFKFQIFNRWGELIFESNDVAIGWDGYYKGQLCQQDVYVWKAYIKLNNGRVFNKSGDVTLLR